MDSEGVKSLGPNDHGERKTRYDHHGKSRIHQCEAVRPPAAKFEPASEQSSRQSE